MHSLRARALAYRRAALYDGEAVTANARKAYRDSFTGGHSCRMCGTVTLPEGLSQVERARRGEALRRMHFANLGLAAARARAATKKAPAPSKADAQEVSGAESTATTAS